jgi:hypothetical protein
MSLALAGSAAMTYNAPRVTRLNERETIMQDNPDLAYRHLAARLNELPNGFPPAPDGAELRLLAYLFTPEEAALAAQLRLTLETPDEIAARLAGDAQALRKQLKSMVTRGLITAGRAPTGGLGYIDKEQNRPASLCLQVCSLMRQSHWRTAQLSN